MANFNDFNWGDDDPGPDTDPTPEEFEALASDLTGLFEEEIDRTNYDEPGAGKTFRGEDPSIWDASGNPERPTEQTDQARGSVEVAEQSATVPDDQQYKRIDDPERREVPTDEQADDNEVDDIKFEDIYSSIEDYMEEIDSDDEEYYDLLDCLDEDLEEYLDYLEEGLEEQYIDELTEQPGSIDIADFSSDLVNESMIIEFQDIDGYYDEEAYI